MKRLLAIPLFCLLLLSGCKPSSLPDPSVPEESPLPEILMPEPDLPAYILPDPQQQDPPYMDSLNIPEEWGSMTALYYKYGGYNSPSYTFTLRQQPGGGLLFEAASYNEAAELDVSSMVELQVLQDLQDIFNDFGLAAWNGFDESDPDVLDGYGFLLAAQFESGETLEARGYMRFPPGYEQGHNAIEAYLLFLASLYPSTSRQPIMVNSASLSVWGKETAP